MLWAKPKPGLTVARAVLIAAPALSGVPVSTVGPTTRPDRYLVLGALDTDYPNPAFTEPRILFHCYAKTKPATEDLANEALAVMLNARGLFAGAQVKKFDEPKGPYEYNDPDITDRFRFQFHGQLRLSTR